jgi:hypothetical protein
MKAMAFARGQVIMNRETRRELTGPALRGFFAIAKAWRLNGDEQARLLGLGSRATLRRWRRGGVQAISRNALERISYVLGIYKAIRLLLPEPGRAAAWIRRPNKAPQFGGRCALDRLLAGNVGDLFVVRRYLDGELEGPMLVPRSTTHALP